MKEEILNYMYELIDIIKEQDIQINHEFSINIDRDMEQTQEEYKERRKKAEELVDKLN